MIGLLSGYLACSAAISKMSDIISPNKWPFFYGWMILLVGAIGVLATSPGQTIGVSAFTDHLLDALKLSRDQLSLSYMGGTMLSALMLTKAGIFFDRFGAMRTAVLASVGLGLALIYLSQADHVSGFFGGGAFVTMACILAGFIFIRFFGQGVLTLASRTMVVKWFDAKRGLAIGVLSMVTAFGFSIAPKIFDQLISAHGWSKAWIVIGGCCGLVFPIIAYIFYKKGPESYGLLPDGISKDKEVEPKKSRFPVYKDYNLSEARRSFSLWIFAGLPALYGMVITGVTFHIVSIFGENGLSKEVAIDVFQPIAFAAVSCTLVASLVSDYVRLKYLAYIFSVAGILAMYSLTALGDDIFYWLMIACFGICSGIHPLIITLFLPRFFGKKYLGAITGQAMMIVVFASSLGPIIFSQSLSLTGDYNLASYICAGLFLFFLIGTIFTTNPQLKHKP